MTDITLSFIWRDYLEIDLLIYRSRIGRQRSGRANGNTLVGVLAISLFLEINGRGRNSDL